MYPKLIVRNVIRNLQTYTIYFLSLTLIYSLLYAFNALPQHPLCKFIWCKADVDNYYTQYMGLLSYVVLVAVDFSYLFNKFCLRTPKRVGIICYA